MHQLLNSYCNQMALKNSLGKCRRLEMITFESISLIRTPTDAGCRATLQGIVTFSLMSEQSKQRCYEGQITGGEATLTFVGFTQQQAQISKVAADDPISLSECSIRSGDSLEVIR